MLRRERDGTGKFCSRVASEVGGTDEQARQVVARRIDRLLHRDTSGDARRRVEHRRRRGPRFAARRLPRCVPLLRRASRDLGVLRARCGTAGSRVAAHCLDRRGIDPERFVGNAHHLLGRGHVGCPERVAVGFGGVGEVGRGRADVRAQDEQRRRTAVRLGGGQRLFEPVEIVGDVAEFDDVPTVRTEALRHVVTARQVGRAVDGDLVVVEHADKPVEFLVAGERRRLVTDALHETTVTGDHEHVVVVQLGAEARTQMTFGDRHADGVGEPLAERTGRHLDAGSVPALGMSWRRRPPLAKLAQVVELESVAVQVQRGVLQDRRVPVGKNEAVAVAPLRLRRIMAHHPAVQHVSERGERHRRALVTALGRERGVHRQPADHRDGETILFFRQPRRHGKRR